nr:unnamed protein product [Callosobruchus analis]
MRAEEVREQLFTNFWNLASYDSQTGFIGSSIKEIPVKKRVPKKVLGIHLVSTKRINTALTKIRDGRLKDERGKSGGKKKLMKILSIKLFPTLKTSLRTYLTTHEEKLKQNFCRKI